MRRKCLHLLFPVLLGAFLTSSAKAGGGIGCSNGYRQATALLNQDKPEEVIASYSWIVTKCPEFYPAYIVLGMAYQRLNNFQKAGEYLREAVQVAPQSARARINLGAYYLSHGRTMQASSEFKKAVVIDPKEPMGWFDLGLSELEAGDAASALAHLQKASRLDPGNLRIELTLISAAFKAGQPGLARQQADKFIANESQNPTRLLLLGALLNEGGDVTKAKQVYRSVREASSNPLPVFFEASNQAAAEGNYRSVLSLLEYVSDDGVRSAPWNEMVGDAYFKLGLVRPAVDHLQEAIKIDPRNEDYYLEFGTLLTQYHANDACLALFQSAEMILPESIKIKSALAVAYMMEKKYAEAEGILEKIIASSPEYLPAYKLLGENYQASHQWEKLKTIGQKIVARNPNEAAGWYYQSRADYEQAMRKGRGLRIAETEVKKSLALDSQYGAAYYLLGEILSAEDRSEEAILALQKASALDDDPTVYYTLALTFRKLGQTSKGAAALKEFKEAVDRKKASYQKLVVRIDYPHAQGASK